MLEGLGTWEGHVHLACCDYHTNEWNHVDNIHDLPKNKGDSILYALWFLNDFNLASMH